MLCVAGLQGGAGGAASISEAGREFLHCCCCLLSFAVQAKKLIKLKEEVRGAVKLTFLAITSIVCGGL